MGGLDRRTFLRGAAAAAGGVMLGGPFSGLLNPRAWAAVPLMPVPDLRDGEVRLWLPARFRYRSFHDTEAPVVLDDGTVLPGRHDGMAAFPNPNGNFWLVRNHEINGPGPAFGPGPSYDAQARGGCTTTEVTLFGNVVQSFTSLNGTQMNCAGGPMPWGSWISCEETVNGPDVGPDFTNASNIPLEQPHGFIFEVPAGGQSTLQPVTAAGRFAHEAVAFDPRQGILYLTEDNFGYPSGFYRYRPNRNPMKTGSLGNKGRLQMLRVQGSPNAHLEAAQSPPVSYPVDWVDIDDPAPTFPYTPGQTAPTSNDTALNYVGDQGRAQGAAHFSRLEGAAFRNGVVYFCSTQGGGAAETGPDTLTGYGNGTGQVWAYDTRTRTLSALYQSPSAATLELPDNITVSPSGTLVLCEDGPADNYVRGLTKNGVLFDIALNRMISSLTGLPRFGDEFAGATFSRRGAHTLFVNLQAGNGVTFAIWGPWSKIGV